MEACIWGGRWMSRLGSRVEPCCLLFPCLSFKIEDQ
jgi:hypothetical protein